MKSFGLIFCLYIWGFLAESRHIDNETLIKAREYSLSKALKSANKLVSQEVVALQDPPKICSELLEIYSGGVINYTGCLINHSRPVEMCLKCFEFRKQYDKNYHKLAKTMVEVKNRTLSCLDVYAHQDRLELIPQLHESVVGVNSIWNQGSCKQCFGDDGQLTPEAKSFLERYHYAMLCFSDFYESAEQLLPDEKSQACQDCEKPYYDVVKYFKRNFFPKHDTVTYKGACIDLQDKNNSTNHIWNTQFHCVQPYSLNVYCYPALFVLLAFFGSMWGYNRPFTGSKEIDVAQKAAGYDNRLRKCILECQTKEKLRRIKRRNISRKKKIEKIKSEETIKC